jgi:hypothetical protein
MQVPVGEHPLVVAVQRLMHPDLRMQAAMMRQLIAVCHSRAFCSAFGSFVM